MQRLEVSCAVRHTHTHTHTHTYIYIYVVRRQRVKQADRMCLLYKITLLCCAVYLFTLPIATSLLLAGNEEEYVRQWEMSSI